MDRLQFVVPVRIQTDPEQPVTEIYSITEALAFLHQWPVGRKGPVYQTACKSCAAVIDHHLTAEEARKSLQGFARITGILAREIHHFPGEDADREPLPPASA